MDPQLLIQFLVWGFGLMGMGLIGALIWFASGNGFFFGTNA
jgi:hypothetical protein